jgi:hypothetical protein
MTPVHDEAEPIAKAFHEAYERLAPSHGYETRKASAKPWSEVPEQNRGLMIAVVSELITWHVIAPGEVHRMIREG